MKGAGTVVVLGAIYWFAMVAAFGLVGLAIGIVLAVVAAIAVVVLVIIMTARAVMNAETALGKIANVGVIATAAFIAFVGVRGPDLEDDLAQQNYDLMYVDPYGWVFAVPTILIVTVVLFFGLLALGADRWVGRLFAVVLLSGSMLVMHYTAAVIFYNGDPPDDGIDQLALSTDLTYVIRLVGPGDHEASADITYDLTSIVVDHVKFHTIREEIEATPLPWKESTTFRKDKPFPYGVSAGNIVVDGDNRGLKIRCEIYVNGVLMKAHVARLNKRDYVECRLDEVP